MTINVPKSYVDAMKKLVGENGLYPSRSELIRCAVHKFLEKELRTAEELTKLIDDDFDDEHFVRIPIENLDENNEKVREFKTYKIVKRLEY